MNDVAARLIGDVKAAGIGLWRLMKLDPAWAEGFDASTGGFLRSFAGPLLALPLYLLVASVVSRDVGGGDRLLWGAGLELIANARTSVWITSSLISTQL